jgi:transcriptional regulator with XRE-family HTH domain
VVPHLKEEGAEMQVELIKTLQAEKGFSNKKIAEATGLSESTISRILSRQVEPKFEDVVRIAVILGASLDALAGIARIEIAEEKSLSSALKEKDAQIEAMKEDHRKATAFLMEQIAVRDRALAQKDKTIDGLMQALLNK